MSNKPQLIPNEPIIAVQLSIVKKFGQVPAEILSRLDYWMDSSTTYRQDEWWDQCFNTHNRKPSFSILSKKTIAMLRRGIDFFLKT